MKFRMDALHYALLAVLILIAVYCGNTLLRKEENLNEEEQGLIVAIGKAMNAGDKKKAEELRKKLKALL